MKKLIILSLLIALIVSCNSNPKENPSSAKQEASKQEDPKVEKGMQLVAKNDCLTCHKIEVPFNGPAYADIAARYPNNEQVIDSLSAKVIKGGMGNWGTAPMLPHPSLSKEDAGLMVQYILSLKK